MTYVRISEFPALTKRIKGPTGKKHPKGQNVLRTKKVPILYSVHTVHAFELPIFLEKYISFVQRLWTYN